MGCMTAKMRLDDVCLMVARMTKEGGFHAALSCVVSMTSSLTPVTDNFNVSLVPLTPGISVSLMEVCDTASIRTRMLNLRENVSVAMKPVEPIKVRLSLVCDSGVTTRYLEIDPQIVWVVYGYAENDVLSNVTWSVN